PPGTPIRSGRRCTSSSASGGCKPREARCAKSAPATPCGSHRARSIGTAPRPTPAWCTSRCRKCSTARPSPGSSTSATRNIPLRSAEERPMRAKANGITINYQIDGAEGAPWLVLSNSLATNLSMWNDQAAALKKSFRVLRYDQRGHGSTDAPAARYTFDLLIADVIALFDALSINRA